MSTPFQISFAPDQPWQAINPITAYQQGAQFGLINIDLGDTAESDLERKILDKVGSYGRQLGRIGDALDVILKHVKLQDLKPEEQDALDILKGQLAAVRQVKPGIARARRRRAERDSIATAMIGGGRERAWDRAAAPRSRLGRETREGRYGARNNRHGRSGPPISPDQGCTGGSLDAFEMTVQPNARMPVAHYHESWDETIVGLWACRLGASTARTSCSSPDNRSSSGAGSSTRSATIRRGRRAASAS